MDADFLTMAQVAQRLGPGRGGRPRKASTVTGWARTGLDGVVLRSEVHGAMRVTRWEWVQEFIDARTAGRVATGRTVLSESAAARDQQDARRRLEAMGAR